MKTFGRTILVGKSQAYGRCHCYLRNGRVFLAFFLMSMSFAAPTRCKDVETIDSSFWRTTQEANQGAGYLLLGVRTEYPRNSWKHEIVRWGFMNEGLKMDVVLMTPRARAVHAAGLAAAEERAFDSAAFDPELYNNGVLFGASQRRTNPAIRRGDFLQIIRVVCEVSKDSIVEPFVVRLDSSGVGYGAYVRGHKIDLRALFPLSLFDGSRKLKFHIYFRDHERKTVKFSKRTIRDLH